MFEEVELNRSVQFRKGFGCALNEGKVYVYGGHYEFNENEIITNELNKVCLNARNVKMVNINSYNCALSTAYFGNLVNINNKLYIIGGISALGNANENTSSNSNPNEDQINQNYNQGNFNTSISNKIMYYDIKKMT